MSGTPELHQRRGAMEGVLFDLGGVLLHFGDGPDDVRQSDLRGLEAVRRHLAEAGYPVPGEQDFCRRIDGLVKDYWQRGFPRQRGLDLRQVVRRELLGLGLRVPLPVQERAWQDFQTAVSPRVRIDEEAAELLAELRAAGLRLGFVSNTLWPLAVHRQDLAAKGILEYFDVQACSSELGRSKPDAGLFRHALEHLATAAERTLFVGDRLFEDVAGASQVGLRTVLRVRPGFPQQGPEPDERIERLAELPAVLERLRCDVRPPVYVVNGPAEPPTAEPGRATPPAEWLEAVEDMVDACRRDPRMLALGIGGSYGAGTADRLSDIDVYLVVRPQAVAEVDDAMPEWLSRFGEVAVLGQRRDLPAIAHGVHRCVYRDGRRCDVLLIGEDRLVPHPFHNSHRVLVDKTGKLSGLVESLAHVVFHVDRDGGFARAASNFCFDAWNCLAALVRGDAWEAQGSLEALRRNLFTMVHLRESGKGYWPGEPHKQLREAAGPLDGQLQATLAADHDLTALRQAFERTLILYRDLCRRHATRRGDTATPDFEQVPDFEQAVASLLEEVARQWEEPVRAAV